jgi:hypothetical protein
MLKAFRAGAAAAIALAFLSGTAYASHRLPRYPLTRCGLDFDHFCRIHGYFDSVPFHYNFAIYPGCLRTERVQTPQGIRRRLVLVCG